MGEDKKPKTIRIVLVAVLILFFLILFLKYLPAKSFNIKSSEKPTTKTQKIPPFNLSLGAEIEEINILALGKPGAGYPGENLTDTIILMHFKPAQEKLVLISLPRDLLVKIPIRPANESESRNFTPRLSMASQTRDAEDIEPLKGAGFTKINHLYSLGGLEMIKQKTEEITGLQINSYILIDLAAVKEIVDLVDGLNILVPQDINDPFFPGPNYSYQAFALSAGWRYLDGETALKYIRTRYTSPNSDFDRMARQQQILKALKQKVLSLNLLWNFPAYLKIFQSLNEHIQTDLGLMEMKSLWQSASRIGASQIIKLVIDKKETNLMTSGPIILNGQISSMVWPKKGQENYDEIRNFIKRTLNDEK